MISCLLGFHVDSFSMVKLRLCFHNSMNYESEGISAQIEEDNETRRKKTCLEKSVSVKSTQRILYTRIQHPKTIVHPSSSFTANVPTDTAIENRNQLAF